MVLHYYELGVGSFFYYIYVNFAIKLDSDNTKTELFWQLFFLNSNQFYFNYLLHNNIIWCCFGYCVIRMP